MQIQCTDDPLNALRRCLEYQYVVFADFHPAGHSRHAFTAPDKPHYFYLVFGGHLVQIPDFLANRRGLIGYLDLGKVIRQSGQFLGTIVLTTGYRDQAPADQCNIGHTDDGDRQAHRCEIKHAVGFAHDTATVLGDHDIWRCTNQCNHATEDRGKG